MKREKGIDAGGARMAGAGCCALLSFVFLFATHEFLNDHFDRLARARQIAVYGEWPFEHFFDPGYFLSLMASALAYRWADERLLGEVILNTTFMAAGSALILSLAVRASGSWFIGIAAAAFSLLSMARAYDFDKVFFYPLGLVAIWRYVDRPTRHRAVVLGARGRAHTPDGAASHRGAACVAWWPGSPVP